MQQVSRTGQGSDRRSGDGRARLERFSQGTGTTVDTDRNRVLHDFWRACFLDFTVALWPVQLTSPKIALRTTTFIQALSGFEQQGITEAPTSVCQAVQRGEGGVVKTAQRWSKLPCPRPGAKSEWF